MQNRQPSNPIVFFISNSLLLFVEEFNPLYRSCRRVGLRSHPTAALMGGDEETGFPNPIRCPLETLLPLGHLREFAISNSQKETG